MRLIERAATSADFDVSKLEKLLDVKEKWEANEARKAFVAALAAFKVSPPTVKKNKRVRYATQKARRNTITPPWPKLPTSSRRPYRSTAFHIAGHKAKRGRDFGHLCAHSRTGP